MHKNKNKRTQIIYRTPHIKNGLWVRKRRILFIRYQMLLEYVEQIFTKTYVRSSFVCMMCASKQHPTAPTIHTPSSVQKEFLYQISPRTTQCMVRLSKKNTFYTHWPQSQQFRLRPSSVHKGFLYQISPSATQYMVCACQKNPHYAH